MLGIIFFSLVFGASLTLLPEEKTKPMVRVLDALGEAIVKIIDFAMRLAPYGVFGLIFVVTSRVGFVLPLGSTMCMNGTALFEGVTVLFLAQVFSVPLTLSQQVVVMFLSVITAVGAAGVPGGSLPLLMGVLAAVNVEPLTIALIIGVDRILDMTRTTINVVGDMSAAVYVARTESEWDPKVISREARPAPAA